MKRRTFLKTIGAITGTLLVNPVKGVKAIAAQGIKPAFQHVQSGSHLLSPATISREMLRLLEDDLIFSSINKKLPKQKKGTTIKIRRWPKL